MIAASPLISIAPLSAPKLLTYEQYMTEGEVHARYDIIDGERHLMTNSTRRHQRVVGNIYDPLRVYEKQAKQGQVILAPCDILVSQNPLETRQPDVLFISSERLAQNGDENEPAPLIAAPEVVVEVLSDTEYRSIREAKIRDYCAVGVREAWMVSPQAETIEVLRLSADGAETVAIYGRHQTLPCLTFPDLTISLADIFAA